MRKSLISLGVGVAAVALSGCGDDGAALEPTTVEITAVDYGFEDVPDEVAVGSTLTLSNDSSVEAHEVVAVKLPDDEDRPASDLVALPEPELMAFLDGVKTVVLAPPDQEGIAVVGDGTLDEAGRYLLICVIPTGADPHEYMEKAATSDGPPDVAGGPPHIANGMWAELDVVDA